MGMGDPVNHPDHYNAHPVCEAIDICEHLPFSLGNAVKYLWRAGMKGHLIEDLRKAAWYLRRAQNRFELIRLPPGIRQLVRLAAEHPASNDTLRKVLMNLYLVAGDNDNQHTGLVLSEMIEHVGAAIVAADTGPPAPAQSGST